jgi:hypothetical protein
MGRLNIPLVPRWNGATDDIDVRDYAERSREFERALLRKDLVFPRPGEIWVALRDFDAYGVLRAASGGAFELPDGCVKQGDRVRILPMDHPRPLYIHFQLANAVAGAREFCLPSARSVASALLHIPEDHFFLELFAPSEG